MFGNSIDVHALSLITLGPSYWFVVSLVVLLVLGLVIARAVLREGWAKVKQDVRGDLTILWDLGLLAGVLVLLTTMVFGWSAIKDAIPVGSNGEIMSLTGTNGNLLVRVPTSEEVGAEEQKLMAAKDDLGLKLQVESKKVLLVPSGTRVRVLDHRWPATRYEVRIIEGKDTGRSGWVPRDRLAKVP